MTVPYTKVLSQLIKQTRGKPVYLVGGYLRDQLLNKNSCDLDLVVPKQAKTVAKKLSRYFRGTFLPLKEETKTYRVVLGSQRTQFYLDISELLDQSLEKDLARRDFTINAMAIPLKEIKNWKLEIENLIDPFHGLKDLKDKVIRLVSEKALVEDPLRMLRAFRLAEELNFTIDSKTLRLIAKHKKGICQSAKERIKEELLKLLRQPHCHRRIREMDSVGLLTQILPELEPSRRCAILYYPKKPALGRIGGVLGHCIDTLELIERRFQEVEKGGDPIAIGLQNYIHEAIAGRFHRLTILKIAALLHDVAKPNTAKKIDGRLRFFEHDNVGARIFKRIGQRLKLGNNAIQSVCRIIQHHLRPGNLAKDKQITPKAVFRFFRDLETDGLGTLLVAQADHATYLLAGYPTARQKDSTAKTGKYLRAIDYLLQKYFQEKNKVQPPKLINGHDVMRAARLQPGPKIGKILLRVQELQVTGKIKTRKEALSFLKRNY